MIARHIDSTNLRPEATAGDIKKLCLEAAEYKMAAVCVHPSRLQLARHYIRNSEVKLCTVIGFPLGAETLATKKFAARQALEQGAEELDMVINLGAVKDHNLNLVEQEIRDIVELKKNQEFILKVIVETALLDKQELINLTHLVGDTGADYIKTSTGFAARGVSLEDIETIQASKSDRLKIKASGGIRTLEFALSLLAAGADRLGTSNAVKIVEECRRK
ncbi:MAG: deoxyribose-phosphate aldolase [Syntrophomonadaceae bacterium]